MVPTELLAFQHYEQLLNLLQNIEEVECKPSVALLTGSTPSKQSRMIREAWHYHLFLCSFSLTILRYLSLRLWVCRVSILEISQWSLGPTV